MQRIVMLNEKFKRRKAIDMALGELLNKQNFTYYSEMRLDSLGNVC